MAIRVHLQSSRQSRSKSGRVIIFMEFETEAAFTARNETKPSKSEHHQVVKLHARSRTHNKNILVMCSLPEWHTVMA